MSKIIKLDKNTYRLYIKGAPERVLTRCSKVLVDDEKKLKDQQEKYASRSFRTIAVGYKEFTIEGKSEEDFFKDEERKDLILMKSS